MDLALVLLIIAISISTRDRTTGGFHLRISRLPVAFMARRGQRVVSPSMLLAVCSGKVTREIGDQSRAVAKPRHSFW
jgi:hypothetical protein